MTKTTLLLTCAISAFAFGGQAAMAADATAAPPAQAAPQGGTTIGEIVVTAERREASLQNVPEAVTAFTAKQRNLIGISTVQDLTNFTPGFTYSSQTDRPAMRGLSRNNNIYLSDSAVAVYYDDFYSNSTFLVGRDDMLVDQVEILLGPQGTLYGRNSVGGLINTISKRPNTDQLGGEVRAVFGSYGYTKFEGTLTGPITDKLSFRLSVVDTNQTDGYLTNLVPGAPSEGGVVHDPYEDFQLQYKDDKNEFWLDFNNINFANDRGGPGGLLAIPTAGSYNGATTASGSLFYSPNFPYSGNAVPGSVVGQIGTDNPALNNIRSFAHPIATDIKVNNAYAFIFHATHHFDGFDAKYVGGYSQYQYQLGTSAFDNDNGPVTSYQIPLDPNGLCATAYAAYGCQPLTVHPAQLFRYDTTTRWFSNEITFSSTNNSKLQWIGGLYQFWQDNVNPITWQAQGQSQLSAPHGSALGATDLPNPKDYYIYANYQDTIQSYAVYGQVDYKLNDQFKLTGGLRFTYDTKSGQEETRLLYFADNAPTSPLYYYNAANFGSFKPALDLTNVLTSSGLTPTGALQKGVTCAAYYATTGNFAGDRIRCLGANSDAVTGTAGVEWTPDLDTLVYARYNRGYKAFGINAGGMTTNPYAAPETVNDFEVGVKKTIGRTFTVDADAFYYNYNDDQVPLLFPTDGINLTQFINIPTAVSDGIELTANWRPIDHLSLSLTYGFNHTSISTGCTVQDVITIENSPATNAKPGACYIDSLDPMATQPGARPVGPADPDDRSPLSSGQRQ